MSKPSRASAKKSVTAARVVDLRAALAQQGCDGLIVPRADEYLGEYVPSCAERLAWLTGFTGSAGLAVVLAEQAVLFVDGRYTLQAGDEVDSATFSVLSITDQPPDRWIAANLPKGAALGFDPRLHSHTAADRFESATRKAGGNMVALAENPIDRLWHDRPPPPTAPAVAHLLAFTGRDAADKRADLANELAKSQIDAAVITATDSVAWLLNMRGGDLPYTPVALATAILHKNGHADLFIDDQKVDAELRAHLGNAVSIAPPEAFGAALDALVKTRVRVDPHTTPDVVFRRLAAAGAKIDERADPCLTPKSIKNDVELNGMRAAHRRDGVAVTRFLHWLDREAIDGAITEIDAADRLEAFRRDGEHLTGLSFPTISGAGANGAIVHYRVTPESNRPLVPGALYLVDSGGQYRDGTTDITRTVVIGDPSDEMRDRFTRVLKGHIAIATACFPVGTTGGQLDVLARQALWQAGLDYDHGTGHGVGSYLNVHEGPHRISKRAGDAPLQPGMIVSNEPGYYKTGAYGIRIENLVAVTRRDAPKGAERELLGFETLTLAPIDRRLIDRGLLNDREIAWLNSYHANVAATLSPLMESDCDAWLHQATQPLS